LLILACQKNMRAHDLSTDTLFCNISDADVGPEHIFAAAAAAAAAAASLLLLMHAPPAQPENLGQNIAVLRGHTASITLIDFHPKLPAALLSASNDGTVRLWDARDHHFAPLLLLPRDGFGAFSSISMAGSSGARRGGAAAGGGSREAAAAAAAAGTAGSGTHRQGVAAAAAAAAAGAAQEVRLPCAYTTVCVMHLDFLV
jgi:WD40 repeat protein